MKETLGQRIQRLRKNANLTQEDVATRLNISSQAVSKWENDNSAPDLSVLLELAEMLGVTTDELLGKTPTVSVVEPAQRKPIEKLLLKIRVLSTDGDKLTFSCCKDYCRQWCGNGASKFQRQKYAQGY